MRESARPEHEWHGHEPPDSSAHATPAASSSFDERAATWDLDPAKVERANRFAALIDQTIDVPSGAALLEVGAGTGLVATALAHRVTTITLTDPSAGMRQVLECKATTPGHPLRGATVEELDLAAPSSHDADRRFDLIVAALVLHHVLDLGTALEVLSAVAAPGGHIAIADLDTEDGSFHGDDFEGHHGLDRDELIRQLGERGWIEATAHDAGTLVKNDRDYRVFLVTARRPG